MRKWVALLLSTLILLTLVAVIGCGNREADVASTTPVSFSIPKDELDPAVWGKAFPDHYASYLKNNEGGMTEYGGSDPVSKFESQPLLTELFKGHGFSIEFKEDRGHTLSLKDVKETKRITAKSTASCMMCKTPTAPKLVAEMGIDFYKQPFSEMIKKAEHPIVCADCHDPKTMQLRAVRQPFIKAMERRGVDISKAGRQEMRSYVCAQCHVEYYFERDTKEVTFPWDKGFTPDEMESYYEEVEPGFSDWEHPDSKAPMIKAQHPEFEAFQNSTHASAGLACADCHMPYMKVGKNKISSHQWTSPLKTISQSCGTCHRQGEDWLKERVNYIQSKTFNLLLEAQAASNDAHKAVQKALSVRGADEKLIKDAQVLVVRGQWRWDYVAAENSTGFHNPVLLIETLGKSIDQSRQAQILAEGAIAGAKQ
ncbi:MAG: ammonia-forming cytochrome c nitrite reductase subunit c552 [Actinobacteria bacterium]|nr:ammonia-forming cytochrome c nitrite reductase subunit c552 [Actinomycetota bacterium]